MSATKEEIKEVTKTTAIVVGTGAAITAVSYYKKAKVGVAAATLAGEYLTLSTVVAGTSLAAGLGAAAVGGVLAYKGGKKLYKKYKARKEKKNRCLVLPDGDATLDDHTEGHGQDGLKKHPQEGKIGEGGRREEEVVEEKEMEGEMEGEMEDPGMEMVEVDLGRNFVCIGCESGVGRLYRVNKDLVFEI